jgi:hypothetical protein
MAAHAIEKRTDGISRLIMGVSAAARKGSWADKIARPRGDKRAGVEKVACTKA